MVEGITEFLPISSTGHLLVAERLMDIPKTDAVDAYTIIIQFGAIVAVFVVSWRHVLSMLQGMTGRNRDGRNLLVALVIAFIPAGVIGKVLGDWVEERLLTPGPVAAAWIVGGVVLIAFARWQRGGAAGRGERPLAALTPKHALVIGVAQVASLWPGTSRSFVTILAGVLVGLSLSAAIEFSFLLGLATLSAASLFSLVTDGGTVRDEIGVGPALVGMAFAFVSALLAVKWMVAYLGRHDFSVFGWYRIGVGVAVFGLIATNTL